LLDRGAFLGSDLVLGHPASALDQSLGVGLRLRDDLVCLVLGAFEKRFAILVDRGGLSLIFGLEHLGFLPQRFRLGELIADQGDLAVERAPDRCRHFLPDEDCKDDDHRQCNPTAGVEPQKCRFPGVRRWRVTDRRLSWLFRH